jgi:hypothetical protein
MKFRRRVAPDEIIPEAGSAPLLFESIELFFDLGAAGIAALGGEVRPAQVVARLEMLEVPRCPGHDAMRQLTVQLPE